MALEVKPVRLGLPGDNGGMLLFKDGALIAILAQLGPHHDQHEGWWHVEAVFDPSLDGVHPNFADLDAARRYFETVG
jgi:hypothetical protein